MKTLKKLAKIAIIIIIVIFIGGVLYKSCINPSVKSYNTPQTKNIGPYVINLTKCEGTVMTLSVKNTTGSRIIYIDKGPGVVKDNILPEELIIIDSDSTAFQTQEDCSIFFFKEEKNGDNIKIKSSGKLTANNHFKYNLE